MSNQNQYALTGSAAEIYERNMVSAIFETFACDLLEFAELRDGEDVLDIACGTGIVVRLAWPGVAPAGRLRQMGFSSYVLPVVGSTTADRRYRSLIGASATQPAALLLSARLRAAGIPRHVISP